MKGSQFKGTLVMFYNNAAFVCNIRHLSDYKTAIKSTFRLRPCRSINEVMARHFSDFWLEK